MKNEGKLFEKDFINSVPESIFHYRFRDLPFFLTNKAKYEVNNNPADFLIFSDNLYILELKSVKGKSYPISNTRENQVEGLLKYSTKDKCVCGFVINYREEEETYFIHIKDYVKLTETRKSINIDMAREFGEFIPQKKKRTRYSYDLNIFLKK